MMMVTKIQNSMFEMCAHQHKILFVLSVRAVNANVEKTIIVKKKKSKILTTKLTVNVALKNTNVFRDCPRGILENCNLGKIVDVGNLLSMSLVR